MEDEITVMSVKGQVVIPKDIRKRLSLKPKDRLIVYGEEDMIIMKRLNLPELKDTWKKISEIVKERNKRHGKLSEEDVNREVAAHRKKWRLVNDQSSIRYEYTRLWTTL